MEISNKFVVTGSWDGSVRIWSIEKKRCEGAGEGHTGHISCSAITNDGQYLVTGSHDTSLKIWNLSEKREAGTLVGLGGRIKCVAITNDNKFIISYSDFCAIRIWDFEQMSQIDEVNMHGKYIHDLAVSRDSKYFASNSTSIINLWHLQERRKICDIEIEKFGKTDVRRIDSMCFSYSNRYLIYNITEKVVVVLDLKQMILIGS